MIIDVYQCEKDTYIKMKILGKLKYVGESFGVDSLTNDKIYNCVDYDEELRLLSVVDDSDEDYMYPMDNPRPLDCSSKGGKWEIIEIYDKKLEKILNSRYK